MTGNNIPDVNLSSLTAIVSMTRLVLDNVVSNDKTSAFAKPESGEAIVSFNEQVDSIILNKIRKFVKV